MNAPQKRLVAVVGAGPAGIFAARELASANVHVILLNRDIKPGGLAEYGIYPDKLKMKNGLRSQFRQILALPDIEYYGNITVGEKADFSLGQLRETGVQAVLVASGAQGTKWLGLEGEDLVGVYHAKDLVYHYNRLPPFSCRDFYIGRKVAIIGVGNVMMDITRYLISLKNVDEVTAVARRGPAEVKFDRKELESVVASMDLPAFDREVDRVAHIMRQLGQDPEDAKGFVRSALPKAVPTDAPTVFKLHFLASPSRLLDDGRGRVGGLEVEENTLILKDGDVKARGLGARQILDVDMVIFAIGDRVDENLGLPVHWDAYDKNPSPRFPVEGESYEAYDSERQQPIEGIFVAGWSRKASSGLVGVARKDGTNGARAVLGYLSELPPAHPSVLEDIRAIISTLDHPVVYEEALAALEKIELEKAQLLGVDDFKFTSNREMLEVMGLLGVVS